MRPGKLHTTDTPVAVLAPGNGKTLTGRFWVYARDDHRSGSTEPAAVWFDFSSDRTGVHPQTQLAAFHRIMLGARTTTSTRARRARTPQTLLTMIGESYGIEADIRGKATR
ncbi:MAG: transposase [Burkholderia sp.]